MPSRVQRSDRRMPQLVFLDDREPVPGGDFHLRPFKNFTRRFSGWTGKMDHVVDQGATRRLRLVGDLRFQCNGFANRDRARLNVQFGGKTGSIGETKQRKGMRVPRLDQAAQSMANYPLTLRRRLFFPASTCRDDFIGMVFGNVVQVVGYGFPDIKLRVVHERLEDRPTGRGVVNDRGQFLSPRQARPGTFGTPAAHVQVRVPGQGIQARIDVFGISVDKRPYGEFGGKSHGQCDHRLH